MSEWKEMLTMSRLRLWRWLPLAGIGMTALHVFASAPGFWWVIPTAGVCTLVWALALAGPGRDRPASVGRAGWTGAAIAAGATFTTMAVAEFGSEVRLGGFAPGALPDVVGLAGISLYAGVIALLFAGWITVPFGAAIAVVAAWRTRS